MFLNSIKELVGLGIESASVKGEDSIRATSQMSVLNESYIFSARERDADVAPERGQRLFLNSKREKKKKSNETAMI